MATLYDIDKQILQALESATAEDIDPETGELLQGDFSILEQLAVARERKLENTGAYIKNLMADVEALKAEENKLKQRRQGKETEINRLKGYVANSMRANNELKFESPKAVFSFRKSTQVNVIDLEAIPAEYIKIKTEKSADKTEIGKLLKAGQEIAGCELIVNHSLQLK